MATAAEFLLQSVAAAYRALSSLSASWVTISTSVDDEFMKTRTEQRSRAMYEAPNRVRLEQGGGRHGSVQVTDGVTAHSLFGHQSRHYRREAAPGIDHLPGLFRPEFPIGNGSVFLFPRIAESVRQADLLDELPAPAELAAIPDLPPLRAVAVQYEFSPGIAATHSSSAVVFWIDTATYLVRGIDVTSTHRMPAHDDTHTSRIRILFTHLAANQNLPAETFSFTPPEGVIEQASPSGTIGSFSGGRGVSRVLPSGERFEHFASIDWQGDALLEKAKMQLHGFALEFDRRFTLADDRHRLLVHERINGPQGPTEREYSIPVEAE